MENQAVDSDTRTRRKSANRDRIVCNSARAQGASALPIEMQSLKEGRLTMTRVQSQLTQELGPIDEDKVRNSTVQLVASAGNRLSTEASSNTPPK